MRKGQRWCESEWHRVRTLLSLIHLRRSLFWCISTRQKLWLTRVMRTGNRPLLQYPAVLQYIATIQIQYWQTSISTSDSWALAVSRNKPAAKSSSDGSIQCNIFIAFAASVNVSQQTLLSNLGRVTFVMTIKSPERSFLSWNVFKDSDA